MMSTWQTLIGSLAVRHSPPPCAKPAARPNKGHAAAAASMAALQSNNRAAVLAQIRGAGPMGISVKRLVIDAGLSINTVDKHVRSLLHAGEIMQVRGYGREHKWAVNAELRGRPLADGPA